MTLRRSVHDARSEYRSGEAETITGACCRELPIPDSQSEHAHEAWAWHTANGDATGSDYTLTNCAGCSTGTAPISAKYWFSITATTSGVDS